MQHAEPLYPTLRPYAMVHRSNECEVVGCRRDYATVVESDAGILFEFCESHAEARVAESDDLHYYEP